MQEITEVGQEPTGTDVLKKLRSLSSFPSGTPERQEYERTQKAIQRERLAEKKQLEGLKYNAKVTVTKADALELLAQRIANPHVREVCYDLAVECAESTGIFPNRFFFAHGYQRSVESRKGRKEVFLAVDPTVIIPSEVVHQGDLYAIWDYSVSWRETDVTFEDFVAMRRILKSDWFELGLFMGKQFEEKPHRGWAEILFPVFTPSLPPNYTQEEMRQWLIKQQSPTHPATTRDFLLQASRNSFKSSVGLIFLTQAILCAPSLRLLSWSRRPRSYPEPSSKRSVVSGKSVTKRIVSNVGSLSTAFRRARAAFLPSSRPCGPRHWPRTRPAPHPSKWQWPVSVSISAGLTTLFPT